MTEHKNGLFFRLCMKFNDSILSRFSNFLSFDVKQPAEKVFERGHTDLLADLARYCARSYRWRTRSFAREMLQEEIVNTIIFRRRVGALSWWPGVLLWTPFSYVALLFSFTFVVILLLAVAPYGLALLRDSQNEWLSAPVENIWDALGFATMWLVTLFFEALELLSSVLVAFFTVLGRWLPAAFVSVFTQSAVVLGLGLAWLIAGVAWLFEPLSPVVFWNPASVQEWVQGHTVHWVQSFLYELRIVFGLALLLGSAIGVLQFLFPWFASARAFGWVDPDGKSATIIFCGSTFIDNFMINACVWRHSNPVRHRGFHRAWSHIKLDVERWLAAEAPKDAEIILSGHSLGGAVAEIAAFDLAPAYSIKLVAALGSSRIGDPQMREIYRNRLDKNESPIHERTWHITHADDTIPRLPPTRYFNHVGHGFLLSSEGGLYRGTRTSIFLDYLTLIHKSGLTRFFFDLNMLTEREKEYPGTENLRNGEQLVISPFKKFMWDVKILAFTVRDIFYVFFQLVVLMAFLICVLGMLPYYGFAILKGLRFDHGVKLYRDALESRRSRLSRLLQSDLRNRTSVGTDAYIPLLQRPFGRSNLRDGPNSPLSDRLTPNSSPSDRLTPHSPLGDKLPSIFFPRTPDRPKE
jgi:Lipase (class 3)